jgi:hypothetical protein
VVVGGSIPRLCALNFLGYSRTVLFFKYADITRTLEQLSGDVLFIAEQLRSVTQLRTVLFRTFELVSNSLLRKKGFA